MATEYTETEEKDSDASPGVEPSDQQIIDDFEEKKSTYADWWDRIYNECRDSEDFTLNGNQLKTDELRRYKFKNPVQPNLLLAYVNHEANDTLTHNYKAVISPNGGGSNVTTAREREYVQRGVQRTGGSAVVYNTARRHQLSGGIRYSIIDIEYARNYGPEKCIHYRDVDDTWGVYPEPNPQTPTFKDIRDFLIKEKVPRAQWLEKTGRDPEKDGFGKSGTKELWQYWCKHELKEDEYLMSDGTTKLESDFPRTDDGPDIQAPIDGVTIALPYPIRKAVKTKWMWYKIFEQEIIDREEWVGERCPLVACTGMRVVDSSGDVHFYPLTKFAEDPQRTYTILANIIMLRIRRSPFSRWMIPFESVDLKQYEELRKASVTGEGDITYKAFDDRGNEIPEPKEIQPFLVDPQIREIMQDQVVQIERILGISDADLGRKTNEVSGRAIEARAQQSNLANYHMTFNFLEYVKDLNEVVLDLIPKVLTAKQQIAYVDEDDNTVMQEINANGVPTFNPMEKYTIAMEVMPDSDTDREAEATNLMNMMDNKFMGPLITQVPGAAAKIILAQRGRYAQEIGKMMEAASNDPEKKQMQTQIAQLQEALKVAQDKNRDESAWTSIDAIKESNRHREEMIKITKDMKVDDVKLMIDAFNATTNRRKIGLPQTAPDDNVE